MRRGGMDALILVMAVALPLRAGTSEPQLLNLPLFPAPLVRQDVPLTKALSEVAVQVRNGYVLFGIELHLEDGKEPTVSLNLKSESILGEGLQQIFQQVSGYTFEVVSEHLIDVYPLDAKRDSGALLNLQVPHFDAVEAQPGDILSRPKDFIPELKARLVRRTPGQPSGELGPGIGNVGPAITVHLHDVTVRQILNAVSEQTEKFPASYSPLGWVCRFSPNPTLPAGGLYSWAAHTSAPSVWKKRAEGQAEK